jgi:hypothetical protein
MSQYETLFQNAGMTEQNWYNFNQSIKSSIESGQTAVLESLNDAFDAFQANINLGSLGQALQASGQHLQTTGNANLKVFGASLEYLGRVMSYGDTSIDFLSGKLTPGDLAASALTSAVVAFGPEILGGLAFSGLAMLTGIGVPALMGAAGAVLAAYPILTAIVIGAAVFGIAWAIGEFFPDFFSGFFPSSLLLPSAPKDPFAFDLDGDGLELVSVANSSARFDFNNDGVREKTGWLSGDDGFLFRDAKNDGKVNGLSELFGNDAVDGYTALSAFDGNGDRKITSADSIFSSLKVWRDLNGDGASQAGEIFNLSSFNIVSIGLSKTAVNRKRPCFPLK